MHVYFSNQDAGRILHIDGNSPMFATHCSFTKQHGCFAFCRNLSRLEAKTIIGVFQGESRALLRCSGSFQKGQQADKAGNDALMHVLETSKIVSCQD